MRSFRADRSRRDGRRRFIALQAEVVAQLRAGATVVSIWETHCAALQMSYAQFNRYVRALQLVPHQGSERRSPMPDVVTRDPRNAASGASTSMRAPFQPPGPARSVDQLDGYAAAVRKKNLI